MALELGPAQVAWGDAGSEVDLGKTLGGVTVRFNESSVDLKSDQYGEAAEDTVLTGTTVEVECPFAEVSYDLLSKILSQDIIGGTATTGFVGENNVGTSLLANAKSLLVTKYVDGVVSTNAADVIHFPAAAPVPNVELSYDASNQRVATATFKCFPATVNANWGTISPVDKVVTYWFGDETSTS
jgi:hypothetical protein